MFTEEQLAYCDATRNRISITYKIVQQTEITRCGGLVVDHFMGIIKSQGSGPQIIEEFFTLIDPIKQQVNICRRYECWSGPPINAHGMVELARYPVEDVLPYTAPKMPSTRAYRVGGMVYNVHMRSDTLDCFRRSSVCSECGIVGTVMVLYKKMNVKPPGQSKKDNTGDQIDACVAHFSLYAIKEDGTEVMMNKDHIQPASRNGSDHLNNYQTMCEKCNHEKSNAIRPSGPHHRVAFPPSEIVVEAV